MRANKAKCKYVFKEVDGTLESTGKIKGNIGLCMNGLLLSVIAECVEQGMPLKTLLESVKENYKLIKEEEHDESNAHKGKETK